MKLEDQVCSLDLSKRLKELNVKQESYFDWWHQQETSDYHVFPSYPSDPGWDIECSAFTVAELGELLGHHVGGRNRLDQNKLEPYWCIEKKGSTEAEARARMLICLIECKLRHQEKAGEGPEYGKAEEETTDENKRGSSEL